jgi:hypothetical protein
MRMEHVLKDVLKKSLLCLSAETQKLIKQWMVV